MRGASASTDSSEMFATHDVRARQAIVGVATRRDVERRRRSRAAFARVASIDGSSTSTAITGPKPSSAAAIESTPEPQPTSSERLRLELLQQLRGRAASSGATPVPNARPGSITTASASAGGASHGGPTQRRPTRTGRWNARQRSSHPASTSAARPPPKNAHMRSSPAASV